MGQRKIVITPELALPIWYKCPFALGHNLYSRCLLDQRFYWLGGVYTASESWTEIPSRTYPQCNHPVETIKLNAHNNQRNKLSTEHKQKFTGLMVLSESWYQMDLTMILHFMLRCCWKLIEKNTQKCKNL